jgi:hypothetical protein
MAVRWNLGLLKVKGMNAPSIYIDVQKKNFRATTRVAPTERFVGATLVVALVGVII